MAEPRTAAGRRLVAEERDPCAIYGDDPGAEDWRDWALREVLAIEAEAYEDGIGEGIRTEAGARAEAVDEHHGQHPDCLYCGSGGEL